MTELRCKRCKDKNVLYPLHDVFVCDECGKEIAEKQMIYCRESDTTDDHFHYCSIDCVLDDVIRESVSVILSFKNYLEESEAVAETKGDIPKDCEHCKHFVFDDKYGPYCKDCFMNVYPPIFMETEECKEFEPNKELKDDD